MAFYYLLCTCSCCVCQEHTLLSPHSSSLNFSVISPGMPTLNIKCFSNMRTSILNKRYRSLYFSIKEQTHGVKINSCLDFLLNVKFFGGQGLSWAPQVAPEVKHLSASAGDARDMGLIPGLGTSSGVGNGSSIFAWKIPWAEEPGGATKSWTQLSTYPSP